MSTPPRRDFFKVAMGSVLCVAQTARATTTTVTLENASHASCADVRMQQASYDCFAFSDGAINHNVYVTGQGPSVIVMHELPGFTSATLGFAERLKHAGFRVYLPHLFGAPMHDAAELNYLRLCINQEFARLRSNTSAPICDWLRALARQLSAQQSGARIGVIGMCVTGAFAIPLVLEPGVAAGVISQPAIPFSLRYRIGFKDDGPWRYELNISDADLDASAKRAARDGVPVVVQRFSADLLCPPQRIERIANAFGNQAQVHEYDKPRDDSKAPHALMTYEYDEAPCIADNPTRVALQRVIGFLREHLG